jgi:predicted TIM-barrel fold metal-dependent hydrolase
MVAQVVSEIIDADGHLFERDEDLQPYLPEPYRENAGSSYYFPTLDGWRRGSFRKGYSDAEGWVKFLDGLEISGTVIYPTAGLGFGFSRDPRWATSLATAYNDFTFRNFKEVSSRLNYVALLPLQDPQAAARELRRAVEERGAVGGLLPAVGLRLPYGDAAYDSVYREAESLGVPLAVHGAPRQSLGFDHIEDSDQAFVLSHPLSLIIQFTNMVFEQVFERFPRLKVVFLEAGVGWAPYIIERIDRRTARRGRRLATEQVRDHPIYFQAELEERQVLLAAIDGIGADRLIYASDYPHERLDDITDALHGFLQRDDVSQEAKQKILCDNVKALYGKGLTVGG